MNPHISSFVDQLLARPPQEANTVQLEIDTDNDVCSMYEVLLLIMAEILKRWYTPPITIGNITPVDGVRLASYFASFGIRFNLMVEDEPAIIRINNRDYLQQTRLEDMKFKLLHDRKLYTVQCSNLPTE